VPFVVIVPLDEMDQVAFSSIGASTGLSMGDLPVKQIESARTSAGKKQVCEDGPTL
jgi:hypothetical protein